MSRLAPSAAENAPLATGAAWREDVEAAEVLACRDQRRGRDKADPADSVAQAGQVVTAAQGPEEDSAVPVAEWPIAPVAVSNVQAIREADFSDPVAMGLAQDWAVGPADWGVGTQARQTDQVSADPATTRPEPTDPEVQETSPDPEVQETSPDQAVIQVRIDLASVVLATTHPVPIAPEGLGTSPVLAITLGPIDPESVAPEAMHPVPIAREGSATPLALVDWLEIPEIGLGLATIRRLRN